VEVTVKTFLVSVAGVALLLLGATAGQGGPFPGATAYYGEWQRHPNGLFFARNYYFLPGDSAASYRHLIVFWLPGRQDVYYYNPYTRQILGRSTVQPEGHDKFFALPRGQEIGVEIARIVDVLQDNILLGSKFKNVKAGSFPTEISLGEGGATASVPIMPVPDDPPFGSPWPPPR
jgi:hypothetical protein